MRLAWAYVRYYKVRSCILIATLSVMLAVPFLSHRLSRTLTEHIVERTEASPVIVTRRGGKIRQALRALFFAEVAGEDELSYGVFEDLLVKGGWSVPLMLKHKTTYGPLVATDIDYFSFRGLQVEQGVLFTIPGEVVVGSSVASRHGLRLDDDIVIQSGDIYDLAQSAPLPLKVTGILEAKGNADDEVIFASLQTVWILDGFLHSHSDEDPYKDNKQGVTSYSKSLKVQQRLSRENLLDFHYHEDMRQLPITHVIFRGQTPKSEVLLMDEINRDDSLMAFRPQSWLNSLLDVFLRIEHFFKIYHFLWSFVAALLVGLLFVLVAQTRKDEYRMLVEIGASRHFMWMNLVQMLGIYLVVSASVAVVWYGCFHVFLGGVSQW